MKPGRFPTSAARRWQHWTNSGPPGRLPAPQELVVLTHARALLATDDRTIAVADVLRIDQVGVSLQAGTSSHVAWSPHAGGAGRGRREDGLDGVLLTSAGRKVNIDGYEKRMLTTTRGALPGFSGSLRRHLYRQADRVAAFIPDATATWTGPSWR